MYVPSRLVKRKHKFCEFMYLFPCKLDFRITDCVKGL